MNDQIYQSLREKLDTISIGFPATSTGVEIEILRKLFTREEAEIGVSLSMVPEPLEVIAARTGRNPLELAAHLKEMIRKGTIFSSQSAEGKTCFHAAPFIHGFAEANSGDMDPELAKLLEQHEADGFVDHFGKLPLESVIRFVPIGETLDSSWAVAPYNKIEEFLRSKKSIATQPCYCRVKSSIIGNGCEQTSKDACFSFDWLADFSVDRGVARYVSLAEALELQRGFEEAGLVNMPTNLQSPLALCHCCGDCCIVFRGTKTLQKPAQAVASDYYMQVDADECNGCETCIERCPMEAIALADSPLGTVGIDLDRCIGCGVCVSQCSVEALKLQEKPEEKKSRKPLDAMEFISDMSKHRGLETSPIF